MRACSRGSSLRWEEGLGFRTLEKSSLIPSPSLPAFAHFLFTLTHSELLCSPCHFVPSLPPSSPISTPPSANSAQPEPLARCSWLLRSDCGLVTCGGRGRGQRLLDLRGQLQPRNSPPLARVGVNPGGRPAKVRHLLRRHPPSLGNHTHNAAGEPGTDTTAARQAAEAAARGAIAAPRSLLNLFIDAPPLFVA